MPFEISSSPGTSPTFSWLGHGSSDDHDWTEAHEYGAELCADRLANVWLPTAGRSRGTPTLDGVIRNHDIPQFVD